MPASLGMEVGNVSSHNGHIVQTCCLSFQSDEGRREQSCNTLIVSFITYSLCLTTTCHCWPHVPRVPLIPKYNMELLCRPAACSSLSFNSQKAILLPGSPSTTVSSQWLQSSIGSTMVSPRVWSSIILLRSNTWFTSCEVLRWLLRPWRQNDVRARCSWIDCSLLRVGASEIQMGQCLF